MNDDYSKLKKMKQLRERAEAALELQSQVPTGAALDGTDRLVHELQTHQIELEMQNEELRQAQVELLESRDKYTSLYDFAPVGYMTLSEKGLIVEANLTAATLLGKGRRALLKQPFSVLIIHEDQGIYYRFRRDLLDGWEKQTCELRMQVQRADPIWVQLDGVVVHSIEPEVIQLRLTITDISRRKRTEEELHRHREHLQELVDERTVELYEAKKAAEDALAQYQSTQKQLLQSEKHAVLGRIAAGVAHEVNSPLGAICSSAAMIRSSYADFLGRLEEMVEWGKEDSASLIMEMMRASLESKPLMLSTRLRRETRDRLREEFTMLDVSLSGLLADLFIDLNLQDRYPAFLKSFQNDSAESRIALLRSLSNIDRGVSLIEIASQRANRIIKALQTFSQRTVEEELRSVNIQDEIETVLEMYHFRFKGDVELVREYDEVPSLECCREQLSQVWTNLILNALQAMNHHGRLTIAVRRHQDEHIAVSIQDTGCGIPKSICGHVFEPFFTTKGNGEGCGLGLDVVRSIVDRHHGKIDFDTTPGKGTIFTVLLPIKQPMG